MYMYNQKIVFIWMRCKRNFSRSALFPHIKSKQQRENKQILNRVRRRLWNGIQTYRNFPTYRLEKILYWISVFIEANPALYIVACTYV